jgi:hypothetical protein
MVLMSNLMLGRYRLTYFSTALLFLLSSTTSALAQSAEPQDPSAPPSAQTTIDSKATTTPPVDEVARTDDADEDAETTPLIPPPEQLEASLQQKVELPEALPVGEPLLITLEVTHPQGALIQPPEITGTQRWSLASSRILSSGGESLPTRTTIELLLVPTIVGTSQIPPMPLLVLGDGGDRVVLKTDPLELKVISTLAQDDPLEFHAARPPVPIYTVDYTPLWVGLGSGGALLLGLIGFLLFRRRLAARPEPEPEPRDIYEVAIEKLQELERSDLLENGKLKLYYTHMSEAVREYLGARYGFPGTELTSTEIMIRLHAVRWPKGLGERDVEEWLRRCDRVKFADMRPGNESSKDALRKAYSILELTRPKPEEEEQQDGAKSGEQDAAQAEESSSLPPRRQRRNAPSLEPSRAVALSERAGDAPLPLPDAKEPALARTSAPEQEAIEEEKAEEAAPAEGTEEKKPSGEPVFGVLDWESLSSMIDETTREEEE